MSGADELMAYSRDLGRVAGKALPDVDAVLKKGAQNVKEQLVREARWSRHFKGIVPSLSYESKYSIGSAGYEIGPDKALSGGGLGNVAYFGTSRGGGTLSLEGPLEMETPNLESELDRLVEGWGADL